MSNDSNSIEIKLKKNPKTIHNYTNFKYTIFSLILLISVPFDCELAFEIPMCVHFIYKFLSIGKYIVSK